MVRRAIAAVIADDYPGHIETVLVFDQSEPDPSLASAEDRRSVRVLTNDRTPGLAGARNTGVLAATGGERIPDPALLTFDGFLRDRMTEVHPSTFLFARQWFLDEVGLVDEDLPGSYVEDYDVLLRAARVGPIASVPEALVRVWWHPATYFRDRWTTIDQALDYLLEKFPEFGGVPAGKARILGQRAFAQAAAGERARALRTIVDVVRLRPTEPRAVVALAVIMGVPAQSILNTLHRFGRGV